MRALGACGLVDCILDFVWFFHRISDYSVALQWLLILLLLVHFLLWCEEWHFNNYYFNDWGTIVSWTWRTTSLSSLASRLFSQKTRHSPSYPHATKITTMMKLSYPYILLPSEKSKGIMKHHTILRWTALYSMLFRLICTAIATPLRSETYRALHHRITIFTSHRPSRHTVSLSQYLE